MIRITRILCPVDFSPQSENAVNYAAGVALKYGASLKLLHVVSPILPAAYEYPLNMAAMLGTMEEVSRRELDEIIHRLKESGVKTRGEVRTGEIFRSIRKTIENYKPDLVVMGTHSRRNVERWFLGSITERLMRHSPVPLLTIAGAKQRAIHDGTFQRILVTTDFSAGTTDALNYAFSMAQENQASLILLHVLNDPSSSYAYDGPVMKGVERQLSKLVPDEVRDWCEVETRTDMGTPYQRILDMVKKERIDLLVMNIHGKGLVERALLGSNAERVVRAAGCPIMLIPPMSRIVKKVRPAKTGGVTRRNKRVA